MKSGLCLLCGGITRWVILARALMGLMKDRHGTYYARVKVPERLQAAVARVLDQGKERQSFLKKSLGTKDLKTANVRAKPVLAGFDRDCSAPPLHWRSS